MRIMDFCDMGVLPAPAIEDRVTGWDRRSPPTSGVTTEAPFEPKWTCDEPRSQSTGLTPGVEVQGPGGCAARGATSPGQWFRGGLLAWRAGREGTPSAGTTTGHACRVWGPRWGSPSRRHVTTMGMTISGEVVHRWILICSRSRRIHPERSLCGRRRNIGAIRNPSVEAPPRFTVPWHVSVHGHPAHSWSPPT